MKNIYTYVAKDGYAARVQDTRSYDAIRSVDSPAPPRSADSRTPLSAKTYCQDGRSLSSLITITQVRTCTNTGEETNIFLETTLLSYRGMLYCRYTAVYL